MVLKASPGRVDSTAHLFNSSKSLGVSDSDVKVSLSCTEPLAWDRKLTAVQPVLKPLETNGIRFVTLSSDATAMPACV